MGLPFEAARKLAGASAGVETSGRPARLPRRAAARSIPGVERRASEDPSASSPAPPADAASEPTPGLVAARLGAALALTVAAVAVLRPFLVSITWAAIVAYVTWPLYRRVRARVRHPRLAAALFTAAMAVLAGLPVAWFLVALAREATEVVEALRAWIEQGAPLPPWVAERPWISGPLEMARTAVPEPLPVAEWLVRYGTRLSSNLVDLASGIARNVLNFAITFVALYVLYLDGERILATVRRLAAALFPYAPARFVDRIGATVRAVVFGLLGTGLVQGVLAGSAFALAGVPAPVALGAVTALLSFVPAGPTLVGAGTVAWLLLEQRVGAALAVGAWILLVVASMDNLLRPLLISQPTRIPFVLVFFGVLGGLAAFGMLGVFVGPVLLSVAFALLAEFARARPDPRDA